MTDIVGVAGVTVAGRLHDVSLELEPGTITAVVGGDGAGKSTLLALLAGATGPDAGEVRRPRSAERIGYVPTRSGYYPDLTVAENLDFVAAAYGLDAATLARSRSVVLDFTGLAPFTSRLARDLSGGMRQKLALALGTLHRPDLLVLDEPTTGVDPVSRADLWRIIANSAASQVRVVVATSYIDEAERSANVLALHRGTTLLQGTPVELATSMRGALVDLDEPLNRRLAWRHGAHWRQWLPDGGDVPPAKTVTPSLEDAVIVATLEAGDGPGESTT